MLRFEWVLNFWFECFTIKFGGNLTWLSTWLYKVQMILRLFWVKIKLDGLDWVYFNLISLGSIPFDSFKKYSAKKIHKC